jgi:hypothetical protein
MTTEAELESAMRQVVDLSPTSAFPGRCPALRGI